MTIATGGLSNPFHFEEWVYPAYRNTIGKVASDPRPRSGERTFVAVLAGQSNISNWGVTKYTPAHQSKIDNVSFVDGGCYQGNDPALGASGADGSWLFRFADKLITAGTFDRVILVPNAVGGSTIEHWQPSSILGHHLPVSFRRCAELGLTVDAVLWQQGESNHGTTGADYQALFASMIAPIRDAGYNAPWFLGKSTWVPGGVTAAGVRAACDALVNGVDIFAGADTDTLGASYRQSSGTSPHFTDAGSDAAAGLWASAIQAVF